MSRNAVPEGVRVDQRQLNQSLQNLEKKLEVLDKCDRRMMIENHMDYARVHATLAYAMNALFFSNYFNFVLFIDLCVVCCVFSLCEDVWGQCWCRASCEEGFGASSGGDEAGQADGKGNGGKAKEIGCRY
jgi:hypothetical protein